MFLFENGRFCPMSRGVSTRRAIARKLIAVSAAFIVLIGCGGGGGGGDGTPGVMRTFNTGTPTAAELTGTGGNDVFTIAGDITGNSPALVINGLVQGGSGRDEVRLARGGMVTDIDFTFLAAGDLTLQDIDVITIDGGTVNRDINAFFARAGVTFNLISGSVGRNVRGSNDDDMFNLDGGTVGGNVDGGAGNDTFIIGSGITISGRIDGRGGEDTLRLATGFTPDSANLFNNVLTLTLSGGGSLSFALASIEDIDITGLIRGGVNPPVVDTTPRMQTFTTGTPTAAELTGFGGDDVFTITGNVTTSALNINGVIDGLGGTDVLQLNTGAVVESISFNAAPPNNGAVHLQNVETIRLNGGTINGAITGSGQNDVFIVAGDITGATPALAIGGLINGGSGNDELQLDTGAVVENINISVDTPTPGDVHVQGVETITLDGGTVNVVIDASAAPTGVRLNLISGVIGADFAAENTDPIFIGSRFNDLTVLAGDFSGDNPEISFIGSIDARGGDDDEVRLIHGGVLPSLTFAPAGFPTTRSDGTVGPVRTLANYETFTIDGGRVDVINARSAAAAMTFNLISGQIGDSDPTSPPGLVLGSEFNDTFIIGANITINGGTINGEMVPFGIIDGGGGMDVLRLALGVTPTRANFLDDILTLTFSGGGITLTLASIEIIDIDGLTTTMLDPGTGSRLGFGGDPARCLFSFFLLCFERERIQPIMQTFATGTPTADQLRGAGGNDVFTITGDATDSALNINGVIDGQRGIDELQLNSGAVVASIAFSNNTPTGGGVHLQNVETITIDGGRVGTGGITAAAALSSVRFNLISGAVGGNITGSRFNDTFIIDSGIMISGMIDGGEGADLLSLASDFTTTAATFSGGTLTLTLSGSSTILTFTLASIETIDIVGFVNLNPALTFTPPTAGDDIFMISTAIGDTSAQTLNSVIDGEGGNDEFQLNSGAVVASITFSSNAPTGGGRVHLQSIETITINGGRVNGDIAGPRAIATTFNINGGTISGNIRGSRENDTFNLTGGTIVGTLDGGVSGNDTFIIAGNTTTTALNIGSPIDGFGDTDTLVLNTNAVVNRIIFIIFSNAPPTSGDVHLRSIETITIDGGRVNGAITGGSRAETFNLNSGTIGGNVVGGGGNDTFNLSSAIEISGFLDGGEGSDTLRYAGASGTTFTARSGLADDPDITDDLGSVQGINRQEDAPAITSLGAGGGGGAPAPAGAGLRGLTVRGIEVLSLSPALNLYGALSDALMQFGQQTAQGFALADLNLATGRGTQMMSKDSPFTKGRIWAHKITHSGNGKGNIGLNLTGLTARADSDYDYEMSLTQHGFDAPVMTTKLGAFSLRAVSHTMTGTIETNVAEANVSGYGAGLAMMWRVHSLSAHITSLAGAYEVETHTSPLNPRAVVSEVSEGSFSAINAVVSAGLADKRDFANGLSLRTSADISWQTLSLDDFNEIGPDGIAINFDKATRFTARVGAALETEHWFSDVVFVHETSSGGTLSSGLSQDYRQDDGTAFEMKFGGKVADLATGLTLKAHIGLRASLINSTALDPSARFDLSWRF